MLTRELTSRLRTGLVLIILLLLPMLYSQTFCLNVLRIGIGLGAVEFALAFPSRVVGASLAVAWAAPSLVFLQTFMDDFGRFTMLDLLWVVLVYSDSLQLLAGKRFGATKMSLSVSPNKTLEGYVIGLALALVLGCGVHRWPVVPMAVALIGGVLGDLAFSAAKRAAGVKDFSRVLGAHGGICDRIDSYIGACHALFWFGRAFPVHVRQAVVESRAL